jgi:superfamily II RNA helicase
MSLEENTRFEQLQQNEINQLKSKQERIAKDYEDVITKQTSLEKEIETYRNLLEGTMKTMVDTITDDYNSTTANQQQQQQNGVSQRMPRSASVDRNSPSTYQSASKLNGHTSSYSRFTTYKQPANESTNSPSVIEIPTINENGLATSKSVGDLSVKNGLHAVEINGLTNGSSSSHSRPPPILQTRRS